MALGDLPQDNPLKNYQYDSPEYIQAILAQMLPELRAESGRAANASGNLYSGAAGADEKQAEEKLAFDLSSKGAEWQANQNSIAEQQGWQAQEDAKKRASDQTQAGIGGLTNAGGQLGGIYLAGKMGAFGHGAGAAPGVVSQLGPWAGGETGQVGGDAVSHLGAGIPGGGGGAAGAPAGGGGLASIGNFMTTPSYGAGSLAAGAAGAYGGYEGGKWANKQLGLAGENSDATKVGAGVGGAIGYGLGGPAGAAIGSGIGSLGAGQYDWMGRQSGLTKGVTNAVGHMGGSSHWNPSAGEKAAAQGVYDKQLAAGPIDPSKVDMAYNARMGVNLGKVDPTKVDVARLTKLGGRFTT